MAHRQASSPANAAFRAYPATFETYACIAGTIRGSAAQILDRRCPNISRKPGYGTGFSEQLLRGYLIVNHYFQSTYKTTLGVFTASARRLLLFCAVGARCADSERGNPLADPRRFQKCEDETTHSPFSVRRSDRRELTKFGSCLGQKVAPLAWIDAPPSRSKPGASSTFWPTIDSRSPTPRECQSCLSPFITSDFLVPTCDFAVPA
jgi:hypothetical protein